MVNSCQAPEFSPNTTCRQSGRNSQCHSISAPMPGGKPGAPSRGEPKQVAQNAQAMADWPQAYRCSLSPADDCGHMAPLQQLEQWYGKNRTVFRRQPGTVAGAGAGLVEEGGEQQLDREGDGSAKCAGIYRCPRLCWKCSRFAPVPAVYPESLSHPVRSAASIDSNTSRMIRREYAPRPDRSINGCHVSDCIH